MSEDIEIINQNTRIEKIKNFFSKNYRKLIGASVLILLILFSYFGYQEYNKSAKLEIAEIYNKITLKGNKKKLYKKDAIKNEINYGKFERKVILPIIINDKSHLETTIEDGILTLKISKKYVKDNSFTINF